MRLPYMLSLMSSSRPRPIGTRSFGSGVRMRLVRVCVSGWWLVAAAAMAATPSLVLAQVAGAEVTGAIRDRAGAPVAGVTVTFASDATNQQRVVVTTNNGVYTAPSLPPGRYRVDVVMPGFKAIRRDGIRIATGETARLDFELTVGDVRVEVVVSDYAATIRAKNDGHGTVWMSEPV